MSDWLNTYFDQEEELDYEQTVNGNPSELTLKIIESLNVGVLHHVDARKEKKNNTFLT